MKEESGVTEVDIGPTAYQHMDSYYRTNQHITSAVKQESATDDTKVDATPDGGAQKECIGAKSNITIGDYRQKTFCSKTNITNHTTGVHASPSFKCNQCDESFKCEKDLKVHTASIHIGLVEECSFCGEYMRPSNLKQHILSAHTGQELRCKICGVTVMSKLDLHLHFNSVHGQQSVDSPFAHLFSQKINYDLHDYSQKIYPSKKNLNAHIKSVHGIIHKCSKCDLRFVNDADLQRHIKLIHTKANHGDRTFFNRCGYCQKIFTGKRSLNAHIKNVHGIVHKCSQCKLSFINKANFQIHIKSVHLEENHEDLPFGHRCGYCQKICPSKRNLNGHIKSVHKIFHRCSECKASFRSEAHLQSHINLLHSEENYKDTYICDYCQKTFSMKLSIVNHITNVHTIGSYKCDLCDESFRCDKDLKAHKASAHIALVKKCKVCDKLMRPCMLKKHMLSVHSGSKLQCKVCGEFVTSTPGLHYHLNKVHGEQSADSPFINRCVYCHRIYAHKRTLNVHMMNVHGGSCHRCYICKAIFISEAFLHKHVKLMHCEEKYEESGESTHPPVGEVNAAASSSKQQQGVIVLKEEPADEELELGPVLFQHMDWNYRPYKEEPLFDGCS